MSTLISLILILVVVIVLEDTAERASFLNLNLTKGLAGQFSFAVRYPKARSDERLTVFDLIDVSLEDDQTFTSPDLRGCSSGSTIAGLVERGQDRQWTKPDSVRVYFESS